MYIPLKDYFVSMIVHISVLILLEPKEIIISFATSINPDQACTSALSDLALYCWLTNFLALILNFKIKQLYSLQSDVNSHCKEYNCFSKYTYSFVPVETLSGYIILKENLNYLISIMFHTFIYRND